MMQLVKLNDVSGVNQLLEGDLCRDGRFYDEFGQPALIIAVDHNSSGELETFLVVP